MDLRLPSIVVVSIIGVIAILLLGDYLGYKFGRPKLAMVGGFTVLGVVVLFAIFAIINSLLK